ncbi:hypothetical protein TL16_g01533 [Triparma laevis f. inornata]|uniref:Myosin motor domain-containing protein n=1 Tax=Triparma laevis f. inornata TaxID=1714386 RepID=A0A9W7DTM2_9STRA|nr:hypothetical protein TL16_g01533 [Triparma laevis f. inornata]
MEVNSKVWVTDPSPSSNLAFIYCTIISSSPTSITLSRTRNHFDPADDFAEPEDWLDDMYGDDVIVRKGGGMEGMKGCMKRMREVRMTRVNVVTRATAMTNDHPSSVSDLISLQHLHSASLLHALSVRFHNHDIYTNTGPILLALNPFTDKMKEKLYGDKVREEPPTDYMRQGLMKSSGIETSTALPPHAYDVADNCYRAMMRERKSQSVLISGESGAGKTETTKIVINYLTSLSENQVDSTSTHTPPTNSSSSIIPKILSSTPLLESFGNACTLRNSNSSRFGKYIQLSFQRSKLCSASISTYLLEKVRVTSHSTGERTYHIFYQIIRGALSCPPSSLEPNFKPRCGNYKLTKYVGSGVELAGFFNYTSQGGAPHLKDYDDLEGYKMCFESMRNLGWNLSTIDSVFSTVAGVLLLGQVEFEEEEIDGESKACIEQTKAVVEDICELWGVDLLRLTHCLTKKTMVTRGETMIISLNVNQAREARDSLARNVYGCLFDWIVKGVNESIQGSKSPDSNGSFSGRIMDIGVLDIFGFECFASNSFEQLCINFTNEALQQQFNAFIFKLEQELYKKEKIQWSFIEFPDNQDVLDLIQGRPDGILAMLDDECRLPKGSDKKWVGRLYKQYGESNSRFSSTSKQKRDCVFCVRHFAGVVEYMAETGFCEKVSGELRRDYEASTQHQLVHYTNPPLPPQNKDELPISAQEVFKQENNAKKFIVDIFSPKVSKSADEKKKSTVGSQFKENLQNLLRKIEATGPHYIRCLKPNDEALPSVLVRKRLIEQLKYGGVLEAVRVARSGYPVRLDHSAFYARYKIILRNRLSSTLPQAPVGQDQCVSLLDDLLALPENLENQLGGEEGRCSRIRKNLPKPIDLVFEKKEVQLGVTKVFMRKTAHNRLEAQRTFVMNTATVLLQSSLRSAMIRKIYLFHRYAAMILQRIWRGYAGRMVGQALRETKAALTVSKNLRMMAARRRYSLLVRGCRLFQQRLRRHVTRKTTAATRIQTYWRMWWRCGIYYGFLKCVIVLQCRCRKFIARRQFKAIKSEQRDVGKLQEEKERLRSEMGALKAMLKSQAKSERKVAAGGGRERVLVDELAVWKGKCNDLEKENLKLKGELARANMESAAIGSRSPPLSPSRTRSADDSSSRSPKGVVGAAETTSMIAKLESELEKQREVVRNEMVKRRLGEAEVIKIRAKLQGVELSDQDIQDLLPPAPPDEDDDYDDDCQMEGEDNKDLSLPSPRQKSRPGLKHRSSMEMGSKLRKQIVQDSQMLIAKEAMKIRNISSGSEDWGTAWDADDDNKNDGVEEVSRMQRTLKLRYAQRGVNVNPEAEGIEMTESKNQNGEAEGSSKPSSSPTWREKPLGSARKNPTQRKRFGGEGVLSPFSFNFLGSKKEGSVWGLGAGYWDIKDQSKKLLALRYYFGDEVRRFEIKMDRFIGDFQEGVELTLWMSSGNGDEDEEDEGDEEEGEEGGFRIKGLPVTAKLTGFAAEGGEGEDAASLSPGQAKGNLLGSSISWANRVSYLRRGSVFGALVGRMGGDKAMESLPFHEILDCRAGCAGAPDGLLPSAKGKSVDAAAEVSDSEERSDELGMW